MRNLRSKTIANEDHEISPTGRADPGSSRHMNSTTMTCPINGRCCRPLEIAGEASYYTKMARFRTPEFYCKSCDIYCRDVDSKEVVDHNLAASYVQIENEDRFYRQRLGFFEFILSLIERHFTSARGRSNGVALVDFGSSYGHLLDLAQMRGFDTVGIELNEDLVKHSIQRGLTVFGQLGDLSKTADAITIIDSLDYVPNPRQTLMEIRHHLKPEGIVVVRVTNRNLYAKLRKGLLRTDDLSTLGDATINYSLKGLKRLFNRCGFAVLKVIPDGGYGKQLSFNKRLLYSASNLLTLMLAKRIILTPGIILMAGLRERGITEGP